MFTAKQKEVSVDIIVLSACSSIFFRLFIKPPKTVYENDEHYKKTGKVLSTYLWKGFVTGFVKNEHIVRYKCYIHSHILPPYHYIRSRSKSSGFIHIMIWWKYGENK
jgi:hypothetical protein